MNDCICGREPCAKRIARGLAPFCRMPSPKSTPLPPNVFASYEAAATYKRSLSGRWKIQSVRVSGGPSRFAVVPA